MINLLYVDLFCGAGGTSTGVESARVNGEQSAKVIACVNHDANAIASHAANHPEALHFTEDIRTLELSPLVAHTKKMQKLFPAAHVVLWASLECTNFSKAKGGQPRDADSRTLAEHLLRYIEALKPDYIQIENVEEFMSWGPMDENGKPFSMKKGEDYLKWLRNVKSYGYLFEHNILNAADYGAYTSRKRFFGIFAKPGLPIVWPGQTHVRTELINRQPDNTLFEIKFEPWKSVKDVLDFTDEGESIFTRKKPLSDKTLERIYAGLIKFVAGGKDKWLLKYTSINGKTGKHNPPSVDEPCPVVSCQDRLGLVNATFLSRYNTVRPEDTCKSIEEPCGVLTTHNRFAKVDCNFISKYYSGRPQSKNYSINEPAHTITCRDCHALISTNFIQQRNSGNPYSKVISIDQPARTLTSTGGNQELVRAEFLSVYYGNGYNHSVNGPAPTVTTKDRLSLVEPRFMCSYNFKDTGRDINKPCPTVLTKDRLSLITPRFIDQQYGQSKPASIDQALGCITTNPKYNLVTPLWVMNTNFNNIGSSLDEPAQTVTANRKWPYLVVLETGKYAIVVYESDSAAMRKIKEFMAIYGIADIKMRMLRIKELKRIMGFPGDYKLIGTQADQKKFIGNAVEVNMARVICEAISKEILKIKRKVA